MIINQACFSPAIRFMIMLAIVVPAFVVLLLFDSTANSMRAASAQRFRYIERAAKEQRCRLEVSRLESLAQSHPFPRLVALHQLCKGSPKCSYPSAVRDACAELNPWVAEMVEKAKQRARKHQATM